MKIITNIFLGLLLSFAALFLYNPSADVAALTPTPAAKVNSFELFWPISAGKTMASKIYTLKLWKENLRGSLIFSKARKADYLTFLSVKRLIEAEALFADGKNDLANKTLDLAIVRLNKAENIAALAKGEEGFKNVSAAIATRLENMTKLANWLKTKYPGNGTKFEQVLTSIKSFEKVL